MEGKGAGASQLEQGGLCLQMALRNVRCEVGQG